MAFIDGDDPINGSLFSFEEWQRMKNNWRGAISPANIQPGMLFSDNTDDRLYHRGAIANRELYQHEVSRTTLPQFQQTDFKGINAVCLDNSPVCINNDMVFLATW